ncbi:response regulator transcription factor [Pseudomonas benzenivorans]|uniref:Response regulator transcription factor n=1 Tax=Pseudomonas benzenivorans TaxID=556533 RepID=A0ABZ0Q2L1_9PSED|nr:response regulator transcription factor [Pseudomonas benzenivorans]WPC06924.1 response regulator transcription factor [Pseudomonas benzenivorans]
MSNSATKPFLLWLDMTHDRSVADLIAHFRGICECRLAEATAMPQRASAQQPDMICMHFDRPDALGLNLLLEVKRCVPSIPITMFTVQHSEELAVWAMRSRVWEYMVLPLSAAEKNRYLRSLMQLCELRRSAVSQGKKPLVERYPSVPDSIRMTAAHQKHRALNKVLQYIDEHFRENIDQKALAQRCGMTSFRFSRLFKEVMGVGFMDYILGKRMDFARELLDNSQMPITSIGYEAGFKDPSYFARSFKQYNGCTPSEYRQSNRGEQPGGLVSAGKDSSQKVIEGLLRGVRA